MIQTEAAKYYDSLTGIRAKAIANSTSTSRYWRHLRPVMVEDSVKLKCEWCENLLSAANPSATAKSHIVPGGCVKHLPEPAAAASAVTADGESSRKRGAGIDGYFVRCPARAQEEAREALALFFYTTNTALHLIENPHLVAAFAAAGVTLESRKVLSTTRLDKTFAKVQQSTDTTLASTELINLATDGWKRQAAAHGAPLINSMVLLPEGGSRFMGVEDTTGKKKDAPFLAELHCTLLDRASGGDSERQNSLVMDNTKANRTALDLIKEQRPHVITLGCQVRCLPNPTL
jgi:hypothetical protein